MKDYHTHHPSPNGGYLCAVTRSDWEHIAATPGMTPCFGIHPWHAAEADPAELAFELDDWLTRYPQAGVGESGLDASPKHAETLDSQRLLLHIHLGAAFRHDRIVHLHGVRAWSELLDILRERERNQIGKFSSVPTPSCPIKHANTAPSPAPRLERLPRARPRVPQARSSLQCRASRALPLCCRGTLRPHPRRAPLPGDR